ncbi:aspartate kinase [Convivina praedatoris]|uniref:Aspartokinase n=1 Tax=Convivina praedatoris TaxID=2880963 RepID=A0ABM9D302_9LACO|nr:aspartate kinase [Convivina sp. LMG 32447]CAH1852107.1 Aspartokinase 3 [Convivina sp. LMG 32447]CAH1852132.1 Aspartokinase 3 [Convivina sp. LMG 32447]CAH1852799.1 Aspartokinase 3 [Convivina sp. LMG 32447]
MKKVVKFGGSSLADGRQYQKVVDIIKSDSQRKVVVVSAPGKRFDDDIKVTDLLIQYAQESQQAGPQTAQTEIIARYQAISDYFQLDAATFVPILDTILALPDQKFIDSDYRLAYFKAHGEKLNAMLMAMVLQKLGLPARFIDPAQAGLIVSDDANSATVLPETYTNLAQLKYEEQDILVFPGFFGITKNEQIATFARGGSDITGSIVARGLGISLYENFTDVSSIYVANPKIIDKPAPIAEMTYREMRELSYAGFSVFNDEAIIPAIEGEVTINVKNTNDPQAPGTMIVPEDGFQPQYPITGVTSSNHFSALYLHRYLLNQEVGLTLKLLQIFYKYGISYEHMPSGIDDLTIIFDNRQFNQTTIQQLCQEVQDVLHPDTLKWIDDYSIIMVVGEGMLRQSKATSEAINVLAQKGIPVNMINQGASQISTMIGTSRADANQAVIDIYHHFFKNRKEA